MDSKSVENSIDKLCWRNFYRCILKIVDTTAPGRSGVMVVRAEKSHSDNAVFSARSPRIRTNILILMRKSDLYIFLHLMVQILSYYTQGGKSAFSERHLTRKSSNVDLGILLASPNLNFKKKVEHHSDAELNGEFDGNNIFDLGSFLLAEISGQRIDIHEYTNSTKKVLCSGKRLRDHPARNGLGSTQRYRDGYLTPKIYYRDLTFNR